MKTSTVNSGCERSRKLVSVSFAIVLGSSSYQQRRSRVSTKNGIQANVTRSPRRMRGSFTVTKSCPAKPLGLSLSDMAAQNAPFATSNNSPQFAAAPIQIFYYDPSTLSPTPLQGGGRLDKYDFTNLQSFGPSNGRHYPGPSNVQ
jgi:hypothetical protein